MSMDLGLIVAVVLLLIRAGAQLLCVDDQQHVTAGATAAAGSC
jgi:hypothetical protein